MAKKKLSAFGAAFDAARKGGAKEFDFGGKKYNTKMKEGGSPAKKKSSLSGPKKGPLMGDRPGSLKVGTPYKNPVVDGAKKIRTNLGNSAALAGGNAKLTKPEKKNAGGFVGAPKVDTKKRPKYKLPKF